METENINSDQPRRWVILAVFTDPLEARMAAAKLEDEGIDTSVGDQRDMTTVLGVTLGSAQIGVAEEDRERAVEILSATPAKSKLCPPPPEDATACPKCGLMADHRPRRGSVLATVARTVGLGAKDDELKCANCGTSWKP